jgi:hypothetical protein
MGSTKIIAETVKFDDSTGISIAEGNAIVTDSAQQTVIIAGKIFRNNKNESILAFNKPLMIIKQDQDSVFITADTLFSARLSDLYKAGDSVKALNPADSLQKDTVNPKDTLMNLRSQISQRSLSGQLPIPSRKTENRGLQNRQH